MRAFQTLVSTMIVLASTSAASADISEGPGGSVGNTIAIGIGIAVAVTLIAGGIWLAWRKRTT